MKTNPQNPFMKCFRAHGTGKILFSKDDCSYNFWEYLCSKYGIDPLRTRQIMLDMPPQVLADTRDRYISPAPGAGE